MVPARSGHGRSAKNIAGRCDLPGASDEV